MSAHRKPVRPVYAPLHPERSRSGALFTIVGFAIGGMATMAYVGVAPADLTPVVVTDREPAVTLAQPWSHPVFQAPVSKVVWPRPRVLNAADVKALAGSTETRPASEATARFKRVWKMRPATTSTERHTTGGGHVERPRAEGSVHRRGDHDHRRGHDEGHRTGSGRVHCVHPDGHAHASDHGKHHRDDGNVGEHHQGSHSQGGHHSSDHGGHQGGAHRGH